MLRTNTPFKIHDENSLSVGKGKMPGKSGLKDSTQKKGLGGSNTGLKSSRKALSNLSTSQVNVRLTTTTPSAKTRESKVSKTDQKVSKTDQKVSFVVESGKAEKAEKTKEAPTKNVSMSSSKLEASEFYYDYDFSTEDMLCTRMVEEEDLYDGVMKSAAKQAEKIRVNPMPFMAMDGVSTFDESECNWNKPGKISHLSLLSLFSLSYISSLSPLSLSLLSLSLSSLSLSLSPISPLSLSLSSLSSPLKPLSYLTLASSTPRNLWH
jgi:hypothetical protein